MFDTFHYYVNFTLLNNFLNRTEHLPLSCTTGLELDVTCVVITNVIIPSVMIRTLSDG
jgi:hypothetical protein